MKVGTEKHWREDEEMNGRHEEGGVKGLRKDCACLIIGLIICNRVPPTTRAAQHRWVIPERKKDRKQGSK